MNVICNCKERNLIIRVIGEIDHHTSEIIRERIDKEFSRSNAKNIIFDFSGINFMDSSGIGIIMGRYRNAEQIGGKIAITGANASLDRIFNISGLYKIINIYEDVEQAVKDLA